jgi:Transposase DDE domain
MPTIAEVTPHLQAVLSEVAERAAHQTGCVQRQRKFGGATLVQTLVLGWLTNPDASLAALCRAAARLGVDIAPQALDQRFTPALATCLHQVLVATLREVVTTEPLLAPLLQRFTGVYLLDSTTIALPDALADVWRGCGGRVPQGSGAALKLQIVVDLCAGTLQGSLHDGRTQDQTAPELAAPLPVGALRLQDLGYFNLGRMAAWDAAGQFYLSRLKTGVVVVTADGQTWDVGRLLAQYPHAVLDQPVLVGGRQRLRCRLIAVRVPPAVAAERRRKLHAEAQRAGTRLSMARLALADWTVVITNVPVDQLTVQEALVLARARWQIELVFKLWKEGGKVDESRSTKPWRILGEVYAKLTAMVIQHWVLLTACGTAPDRSLRQAAAALREELPALLWAWGQPAEVVRVLERIVRVVVRTPGVGRRRRRPAAHQLWCDPSLQWSGWEDQPAPAPTAPPESLLQVA